MIARFLVSFLSQVLMLICVGIFILSVAYDQFPPPMDKVKLVYANFRNIAKQAVQVQELNKTNFQKLMAAVTANNGNYAGGVPGAIPNNLPGTPPVETSLTLSPQVAELQSQVLDLKIRLKSMESLENHLQEQVGILETRLGAMGSAANKQRTR